MQFKDNRDGKGIYSVIDGEKVYFSEEEKDKLLSGCIYENGEIVETQEYFESQSSKKILEIKEKYKQIILSQYSETDQANMTARVSEITTLCMLESRTPTEEELAYIEVGKTMIAFIREQRVLCEQEILQINN